MKKIIYQALAAIIMAVSVMACDKKSPQLDEAPPAIQIQENLQLHEYSVILYGEKGFNAITLDAGHLHDKEFRINKEFQMPALSGHEFRLVVKANDHDDNLANERVSIFTK